MYDSIGRVFYRRIKFSFPEAAPSFFPRSQVSSPCLVPLSHRPRFALLWLRFPTSLAFYPLNPTNSRVGALMPSTLLPQPVRPWPLERLPQYLRAVSDPLLPLWGRTARTCFPVLPACPVQSRYLVRAPDTASDNPPSPPDTVPPVPTLCIPLDQVL